MGERFSKTLGEHADKDKIKSTNPSAESEKSTEGAKVPKAQKNRAAKCRSALNKYSID